MKPTRCVRVFWLTEDEIITAVSGQFRNRVLVLKKLDLPPDAEILRVTYDFSRQAFGFLVSSDSFEPVDEAVQAPDARGVLSHAIRLTKVDFANALLPWEADGHPVTEAVSPNAEEP